jgi:hypothetical protein
VVLLRGLNVRDFSVYEWEQNKTSVNGGEEFLLHLPSPKRVHIVCLGGNTAQRSLHFCQMYANPLKLFFPKLF